MNDRERHDDRLEPDKIPETLVRVQDVPDEATGTMLVDFLRSQGIDAALAPVEISMLPGVESVGHGYWGYVEVLERDAPQARERITAYLASASAEPVPPGPDDEPEDAA